MCVPASMYDAMAAVLAAMSQFTVLVLDNRGMGRSDAPFSGLLGGIGYTVHDLAADAWAVIDAVVADVHAARRESAIDLGVEELKGGGADGGEQKSAWWKGGSLLLKEVALVGHSMGGMIVQEMVSQRPRRVRFIALLSTHAGGAWNLMPTTRMLTSLMRVAWSGFDRDVHAAVNLSLHFTQRFLDAWVAPDLQLGGEQKKEDREDGNEKREEEGEEEEEGGEGGEDGEDGEDGEGAKNGEKEEGEEGEKGEKKGEGEEGEKSGEKEKGEKKEEEKGRRVNEEEWVGCETEYEDDMSEAADLLAVGGGVAGFGYLESKMVELVRDAQVYFGLTHALTDSLWKPQRAIVNAIAKRRRIARRRRREIYHDKYTGVEPSLQSQRSIVDVSVSTSSSAITHPEDSPYAMFGHAAVVRSHGLSRSIAWKLKQCTRVVKLVMTGRHDQVVTPSSSRALATAIGANTVVEVEAAHFITDEAAAEVTTHVIYGLRKAFFAPMSGLPCECEWCEEQKPNVETELSTCRMC